MAKINLEEIKKVVENALNGKELATYANFLDVRDALTESGIFGNDKIACRKDDNYNYSIVYQGYSIIGFKVGRTTKQLRYGSCFAISGVKEIYFFKHSFDEPTEQEKDWDEIKTEIKGLVDKYRHATEAEHEKNLSVLKDILSKTGLTTSDFDSFVRYYKNHEYELKNHLED